MWSDLADQANEMNPSLFEESIKAALAQNKRTLNYVRGIITSCISEGTMPGSKTALTPKKRAPTLPPDTPYVHPVTGELMNGKNTSQPSATPTT